MADSAGTVAVVAGAAVRARAVVAAFARGAAGFGFARDAAGFGFARDAAGFGFARDATAFGVARTVAAVSGAEGVPGDPVAGELPGADDAAPPARPGRSRLALRRAGRVRGRLVRTSRSVPLASLSLGGMARLCPNTSGPPAGAPKHRRVRTVSAPHLVATVAGTRRFRRTESMPYHEGSTFERYGGVAYVP